MPLKLNVGLSRKVGEANYGSRGASVNVEMELDSGLVAEPGKLQERIRQLFTLVRSSLAEELNGGNGHNGSNGDNGHHANGNNGGGRSTPRPATQSQVRAIKAIASNQRLDLVTLLRERFRVARPEELSIKEASQLIDSLKSPTGREGG